jgi:hypothetical protein
MSMWRRFLSQRLKTGEILVLLSPADTDLSGTQEMLHFANNSMSNGTITEPKAYSRKLLRLSFSTLSFA